jgi:hypothetical protein
LAHYESMIDETFWPENALFAAVTADGHVRWALLTLTHKTRSSRIWIRARIRESGVKRGA